MVAPDSTVTSGPKTTFGPITTSRPTTVSRAKKTDGGVGERGAVRHRLGAGAGLEGGLGGGEVGAGVDAEGLGLGAGDDGGGEAAGAGEGDDVGQVVFALGVVVADLAEEVERGWRRRRRGGRSCRGGWRAGRGVGVLGLDDGGERAVRRRGRGGRSRRGPRPRSRGRRRAAPAARASSIACSVSGRTKGVSP